jgi:hypothetical protein
VGSDLALKGRLNLSGALHLTANGGHVTVEGKIVLAEVPLQEVKVDNAHASDATAVPLPTPAPTDLGQCVWICTSFNSSVTVNDTTAVALGTCLQGNQQTWPGMVLPSISNRGVLIDGIPVNVEGDTGVMLPTGAPVTFRLARQPTG